jgi:hypothetical protein
MVVINLVLLTPLYVLSLNSYNFITYNDAHGEHDGEHAHVFAAPTPVLICSMEDEECRLRTVSADDVCCLWLWAASDGLLQTCVRQILS